MPPADAERTEPEIVAQAIQGEIDAFGRLYDLYLDSIYNFIFYQVSSREEAEDLTEMVFLKAFEKLAEFRDQKVMENFRAWLYRIARNLVIDHYRTRKPTTHLDPEAPIEASDLAPETEVQLRDEIREAMNVIRELEEPFKQVIILRFIEGLAYREVAEIMEIKLNYVRVLQHRALNMIRTRLEDSQAQRL